MKKSLILIAISILLGTTAALASTELSKGQSMILCGEFQDVNKQITSDRVSIYHTEQIGNSNRYEIITVNISTPFSVSNLTQEIDSRVCVLITKE